MRNPTLFKARGVWQARIWNTETKKYINRSLGIRAEGKTERRKEAEVAMYRLAAELTGMTPPPVKPESHADDALLDFIEWFWTPESDYVQKKAVVNKTPLSTHYLKSSHACVRLYMRGFDGFSGLTVRELAQSIIDTWMIWASKQGWSGKIINDALKAMRIPVRWSLRRAGIDRDPFAFLEKAYHKEKKRGILTPAEIKKLLASPVKDERGRLAIYLSLYCSMRLGEVRGLKWGDIKDGIIHIRNNRQEGEGMKSPKCGSEGYVPVPRVVADLLVRVWDKAPGIGPEDFVLAFYPGESMSIKAIRKALDSDLDAIGINEAERKARNIVFHSLRHSFITACRMAGLNAMETMALSRHKDEKMLIRYSTEHAQEAVDLADIKARIDSSFGALPV